MAKNLSTTTRLVKILLVEDNLAEARFLQEILKGTSLEQFSFTAVQRLDQAISALRSSEGGARLNQHFDICLLDLTLPDSFGLDSLRWLSQQCPNLPIVVLTSTNDDNLAIEAVRQGAQDYLVKRNVTSEVLVRAIRYAIERKQTTKALQEANEVLELRVQERTCELQQANDLLKQEIHQRQSIQEKLELAQKVCGIGVFEWNIQDDHFKLSPELELLYQCVPGQLATYADWIATIHENDCDRIEQEVLHAVQTQTLLDTEFRILGATGEIRWFATRGSVFCDESGKPLRMLGISTDITEKKQLEAQFLRAQRLESIGTLASGIAHDLNNVLTPILAVTQLLMLKLPNLEERNRQLLQLLEMSSKRGAEIVKQILSFARGVEGQRMPFNMGHLVGEVQSMLQQTLPKSIEIHADIASDLWMVSGDVTQLQQVLMNLCVNARDAMPHCGQLSLSVKNLTVDSAIARKHLDAKVGNYVVMTIADTGSGIPPEIVDRIFDPFFTTKEVGKGTGLGLSAVMGIVKSHGGFIDVQSIVNRGSQFRIYLPTSQDVAPPRTSDLTVFSGQSELILVVDDEAAICEATKSALEAYNYRVITAENGQDAIARYLECQQDISGILIDMIMPKMDGLTTIPQLRRINVNVPIIAMTGQVSREAMAQMTEMQIQGLLQKPFTTQELLQVLRQITASAAR